MNAKLEATEEQARTTTALAVSKFLAYEEMTQIKGSSYDKGVQDFTYTMVTKQLDWDLSFLSAKLSSMVAEWRAFIPSSDEPPIPQFSKPPVTLSSEPLVTPPPLKDYPKQVIEANLEEGDGSGDNLERINDPRGILDH